MPTKRRKIYKKKTAKTKRGKRARRGTQKIIQTGGEGESISDEFIKLLEEIITKSTDKNKDAIIVDLTVLLRVLKDAAADDDADADHDHDAFLRKVDAFQGENPPPITAP